MQNADIMVNLKFLEKFRENAENTAGNLLKMLRKFLKIMIFGDSDKFQNNLREILHKFLREFMKFQESAGRCS